jgi:C4-dicarboxylate transporter DctM subunit
MILVSLVFFVLLVIGVPVAVAVGAAGYVGALLAAPAPMATGVQTILHQVDSFVLLSLPLFILAGALMETGGIARRLVALAVALVGWIRGGLGMAVITAEYIFSGISGSTVADVSAVAATTIPGMVRAGYSKELAVAVVSAASAMGILVPPCILMIVIGSVASLSVAALFTAGFLPAVVLALALMVYVWWKAGKIGIASEPVPTAAGVARAFWRALIPLGMPAIIFGGILGGIMTPTEASVLAVLYAAIVGLFIYREIKWRDLPEIIVKSAMVTGAVGLLLGTAGLVSWFLTVQQLPDKLIRLMTIVPGSSLVFLFTTAVIFVFFGAVIEGLPAVVILLPSLLPVAKGLGIDPIHYAIVIVAAVGIGLFLPPIGVGLFIACGIADLSVDRATPAMMPFVAVLSVGLAVVVLVPWITLVLPRLFKLL